MIYRNTSNIMVKTLVELLLGRSEGLPATADFNLCKPILFKADEKATNAPAKFIIRKSLNTLFVQPEFLTLTIQWATISLKKEGRYDGIEMLSRYL